MTAEAIFMNDRKSMLIANGDAKAMSCIEDGARTHYYFDRVSPPYRPRSSIDADRFHALSTLSLTVPPCNLLLLLHTGVRGAARATR